MFNVLNLFSWKTWFIISLVTIGIFWIIWGGKEEYEFIGVKPLSTPKIFDERIYQNSEIYETPNIYNMRNKPVINSGLNKGEEIVAQVLSDILESEVQRNVRPNFLCNPETGKNMELDCYNEEYSIAVEYNGIQHYKFPSVFYKTEKEFYDQLYRDRLKRKLCDENGVYLISVPYWVDLFDSQDEHLKESDAKRKVSFVPRDVRYQRIYDYVYPKIREYFEIIFPEKENGTENYGIGWSIYDSM